MTVKQVITTLDYHTAGEPLRIIRTGLPSIPGSTMLEKRRYMQSNHDDIRRLLMLEPRGHADMYGVVITDPVEPGSDCGVLFLHNEGYSTMCGHGIIAVVTAAVEHQLFKITDTRSIKIDSPAGLIQASAILSGDKVESVSFLNVPSFVLKSNLTVPFGQSQISATVAYGGAFYAYINAEDVGLELMPGNSAELVRLGQELKASVSTLIDVTHPEGGEDLNFLYGVIFVQEGNEQSPSRNVCIFADGELDRSPTGTGVSGRAAILYASGDIGLNQVLTIDSILGTSFTVECVEEVTVGDIPAVLTRVRGSAWMTGEHRFVLEENDPLAAGFLIR
ncbi:MAG: proline racemase [Rhodothermales bacterium]|jgi:proline racemase